MKKKSIARHFKLTPLTIGGILILIAVFGYYSMGMKKNRMLASMDAQLFDTMFRWRGTQPVSGQVTIIDIDEKSLKRLGQWPWSRNVVAELVRQVKAAGGRVIGLDMVFPEPDRTSPSQYFSIFGPRMGRAWPVVEEWIKNNPEVNYDSVLGDALYSSPTVLGYAFSFSGQNFQSEENAPFSSSRFNLRPGNQPYTKTLLLNAHGAILNHPDVAHAETEGFTNVFPNVSGTIHNVPLVVQYHGIPFPSLALEIARIGLGIDSITLQASSQSIAGKKALLGIYLGDRFIPTDTKCQLTLNYRGGNRTFRYVSAVDAYEGRTRGLKGQFVIIGTSAAGLPDLRATPFSHVFPGVEVHATVIDNLISGDPMRYDRLTEIGITYALILAGGGILCLLLSITGPLTSSFVGSVIISGAVWFNYNFFFLENRLVGLVYPLGVLLLLFIVVMVFKYFFEGRDRRFIYRAFSQYVSPKLINQLVDRPDRLSLAGEQKEVSVFFSDIRDFTNISEKISSQQLSRLMNEYLSAMSNIIISYDGMVDKFIGDAVMALWGAPLPDSRHAIHAVTAAMNMVPALERLNHQWTEQGLPEVRIGMGINSGLVSVGNFGSEQRFDYTAIGDNVNLSARLESLTKSYGVNLLISEYVHSEVADSVFCRCVDWVRVKGKDTPVKIYEPLSLTEPGYSLKQEVAAFESALTAYRNKEFDTAKDIILGLHKENPQKLYQVYLDRISDFALRPPGENWDGVFTFTIK